MDITPVIPKGYKVIKGYGNKSFKIGGEEINGNILISPFQLSKWEANPEHLTITDKDLDSHGAIELVLIGCGETQLKLPSHIHDYCSKRGIAVDIMNTGAACRTYNVLIAEGRDVVAALIAV